MQKKTDFLIPVAFTSSIPITDPAALMVMQQALNMIPKCAELMLQEYSDEMHPNEIKAARYLLECSIKVDPDYGQR